MKTSQTRILLLIVLAGCAQSEKKDREAVRKVIEGIIEANNNADAPLLRICHLNFLIPRFEASELR